jgi:hypothetical protein
MKATRNDVVRERQAKRRAQAQEEQTRSRALHLDEVRENRARLDIRATFVTFIVPYLAADHLLPYLDANSILSLARTCTESRASVKLKRGVYSMAVAIHHTACTNELQRHKKLVAQIKYAKEEMEKMRKQSAFDFRLMIDTQRQLDVATKRLQKKLGFSYKQYCTDEINRQNAEVAQRAQQQSNASATAAAQRAQQRAQRRSNASIAAAAAASAIYF